MTTPITGPINRHYQHAPLTWPDATNPNNPNVVLYRDIDWDSVGYRQRKPYNLPLVARLLRREVVTKSSFPQWEATNSTGEPWGKAFDRTHFAQEIGWVKQGARAKFSSRVQESASWMVSLAERRQTMNTLTSRLKQFTSVVVALRSRKWTLAYKLLGGFEQKGRQFVQPKKLHRAFADNLLEWRFLIAPLIDDIYKSVDVLQQPIKNAACKGRSKVTGTRLVNPGGAAGLHTWEAVCTCGAYVEVDNANLYLANRLGLVNPISAGLDLLKYSFILGWFVNLQQVVEQYTEFLGLNVVNPYYSIKTFDVLHVLYTSSPVVSPVGVNTCVDFERIVGALPDVVLQIRKPWRLSPTRAVTAISLLLQKLK